MGFRERPDLGETVKERNPSYVEARQSAQQRTQTDQS